MRNPKITLSVGLLFMSGLILSISGGIPFLKASAVEAGGDLKIDWGEPVGKPIFVLENLAPGEVHTRTFKVTNNAKLTRLVGIRGQKIEEVGDLSQAFTLVIRENNHDLYGGTKGTKTLADFFTDSQSKTGIPLNLLRGRTTTKFTIEAKFIPQSGNEYQDTRVRFNLILGITADIPAECKMKLDVFQTIYGTEGNDKLTGTAGNDLIFGLEGNDTLRGGGGEDCLVGNEGNDSIYGEYSEDVLLGNTGDDKLYGGLNDDLIYGGEGNDTVSGGENDDLIYGGGGSDNLAGDNQDDQIYGGEGADIIKGGKGNDRLFGESGNDNLQGGSEEDYLDGGEGKDMLDGGSNQDRCLGEIKKNCEF